MTRKFCLLLAATAAIALPPMQAVAQEKADTPGEIVVSGVLDEEQPVVNQVTRTITQRPRTGKPLSRQYAQVCVGVFGMAPEYAQVIITRVEANARALDIPVGGDGCQVNTLIGFVKDSKAEVVKLRKEQPWLFSTMLDYQYERILKGNGAVQAWHATMVKGANGKEFASAVIAGREVVINKQFSASNIADQVRVDMEGSIVLFDTAFVPGKTLQQLADYASMRSFASVLDLSDGDPAGPPTILTLFNKDGTAPDGLSPYDWSYLTALYKLPATASGDALIDATWSEYRKGGIAPDGR